MLTSNSYRARLARWSLTLALVCAWSGWFQVAPVVAAPADADKPQQQIAALLQRLSAISQRELAKPGADPSDVKQKAASLDNDPDKVFAFVRDQVRYEPYAGVLRGDRGTLLAMSGNATDKSLLLASMLEAGGIRTRLVKGDLPADKAAALVGQFLSAPITSGPIADAVTDGAKQPLLNTEGQDFLARVAKETGLQQEALTKTVTRDAERAELVNSHAWAIVDRETPELQKRLSAAGVKLGRSAEKTQAELAARAAKHVWVEMQDPADAGKWIALDPTLPGSQRGQAAVAGQPYTIGEADEHTVTVRLVYRHGPAGSQAKDAELINVPMTTRHAASHFAQLVVNPADDLPPASQLMAMSKEQLIKTMGAIKRFQPALRVGGKSYFGKAFDLKGNLYDIPADGRLAGASAMGGAAGGLFGGGALAGGSDKPDEGPGTFQELLISVEITAPGGQPQRQARTILTAKDVAGPAIKSPLITWDLLIQPGPLGGKMVSYHTVRSLVAALAPVVGEADKGPAGKELDRVASVRPEPCPALLLTLALMRERAMARLLKDNANVALLWDSPFVAFGERTFCMNPEAGAACSNSRIDIVDNTQKYLARQAGAEAAAAAATMRQGVFDTAAEAAALRESQVSPGAAKPPAVYSAVDDFVQARKSGDALGVVRVEPGKAPTEVALADSDRTWVSKNEPAGRVIVAPSKAVEGTRPGWWTIDPDTGATLGRRSGGGGEAMSEKAILTNMIAFHVCMISPIWDAASGNVKDTKAGMKMSLAIVGCIVGMVVGFGPGMATAARAENIGLMWAIFGAALVAGDKLLS